VTTYWCEHAWLPPGEVRDRVLVRVEGSRIGAVEPDSDPPPDAARLAGLTLPGMANAHSHAFHRALRGRTHGGRGSFWTWREQMYDVASVLDPDSYFELALATYAEMALAGITCVGEFHYLHHAPGGTPYADPNAMGVALVEAAREAGLRIALLDTCYLSAGFGRPLVGVQERFGDGSAEAWAERVAELHGEQDVVVGAAIHSVRAVPADDLPLVAAALPHAPLHVHLSEQRKENADCLAAYGTTPTQLLNDAGALGPRATAVHATHLDPADVRVLGGSRTAVCMCPTTERDLADGIGPAPALARAGSPVCVGSDSHAVIDLFEEARALELDERLRTEERGHWSPDDLLRVATEDGHASLGFAEAGALAPGAWADLVSVRTSSPRTAGVELDGLVFAATASDVHSVVSGGRVVVSDGQHVVGDVGALLDRSVGAIWKALA
jgi:formiminoglutamate deiminase